LGGILVTAAMMDDVVGLIMVQVIIALGNKGTTNGFTIARPIIASLAFLLFLVLVCKSVPLFSRIVPERLKSRFSFHERSKYALVMHSAVLFGFVVGGSYAGLSPLFAAFLAGIFSSYLAPTSAEYIFEKYYDQVTQRMLAPFFFASIGFVIPVKSLWAAGLVWRGLIYSAIQFIAKGVVSFWLIIWGIRSRLRKKNAHKSMHQTSQSAMPQEEPLISSNGSLLLTSMILSFAMISRGEIGFLIASLAESRAVFSKDDSQGASELYLLSIWALFVCTILGPLGVGFAVRTFRKKSKVVSGISNQPQTEVKLSVLSRSDGLASS